MALREAVADVLAVDDPEAQIKDREIVRPVGVDDVHGAAQQHGIQVPVLGSKIKLAARARLAGESGRDFVDGGHAGA